MSSLIANSPAQAPAVRGHDAADHADFDRGPFRSRIWVLVEALAYAGAAFDPAAALAAHRFAQLRDQELRDGRR
jgi:hypothetical protein